MLIKLWNIEQQRMDAPGFRQPDDAFDIDLDHSGIEMDREPPRDKSAISGILKGGAQFANDLTQRAARFLLIRPAPQQTDQPFTAFVFALGQGKITENGGCFLGSQLNRPS